MFSFLCTTHSMKQAPACDEHRAELDYRDRLSYHHEFYDCMECDIMYGSVAISLHTMNTIMIEAPLFRGTVIRCCDEGCFATVKPKPRDLCEWRLRLIFSGLSYDSIHRGFHAGTIDPRETSSDYGGGDAGGGGRSQSDNKCRFCAATEPAKCRCNCRYVVTPLANSFDVPYFHGPLTRNVATREATFSEEHRSDAGFSEDLRRALAMLGFAFDSRVQSARCATCGFVPSCLDLLILFPDKHTFLNAQTILGGRHVASVADYLHYALVDCAGERSRVNNINDYAREVSSNANASNDVIDDIAEREQYCQVITRELMPASGEVPANDRIVTYRDFIRAVIANPKRDNCDACRLEKLRAGLAKLNDLHAKVRRKCPNVLHTDRFLSQWLDAKKSVPRRLMSRQLGL